MTEDDLVLACARLGPRGPLRDVGRIGAIVECGAGPRDAAGERFDLGGHPTGHPHETAAFEAMQALRSDPEAVQDE